MERRKFLMGVGSLAAGSAAAMGTGAFTSVEADRSLTVDVANDANAFLTLEPEDSANGNEYANQTSEGVIELDFSETDAGGEGLNQNADTIIRDVLKVTNRGTETVVVGVTNLPDGMSIYTDDSDLSYIQDQPYDSSTLNQDAQGAGSSNLPRVEPGETMNRVGVIFRGRNNDLSNLEDFEGHLVFNAYTEDEV